jgi:hypothetical protein
MKEAFGPYAHRSQFYEPLDFSPKRSSNKLLWVVACLIIVMVIAQIGHVFADDNTPPRWSFKTLASHYGKGDGFHGRRTANGEIHNMHAMTAAHPTLPFGTLLVVTNERNGKTITVRVNDRGPYVRGRGID